MPRAGASKRRESTASHNKKGVDQAPFARGPEDTNHLPPRLAELQKLKACGPKSD